MIWNSNCDHFTYISLKKYLGSKDLKTSCILVHPNIYSNVGNWRRTTRTTYLLILLRQRFFFLFIIIREVSSYTSCYALQVLLWRVTVAYYYYCNSKNSCPAPSFRLCNSQWNFLKLKTVQRITFFSTCLYFSDI